MYYQTIELYFHMIIDLTNYFYWFHFSKFKKIYYHLATITFFAYKCLVSGRKDILSYKIKEFVVGSESRNLQQWLIVRILRWKVGKRSSKSVLHLLEKMLLYLLLVPLRLTWLSSSINIISRLNHKMGFVMIGSLIINSFQKVVLIHNHSVWVTVLFCIN